MKFLLNFLTFGLAAAVLPIHGTPKRVLKQFDSIQADSPMGMDLLSRARKLDGDVDFTWVANFSIKFQGCHHISQWNDEADEENDVRIETKRLIRFRLCPSNECSASKAGGCDSDYGDYVIDMNTFLETYYGALDNYNQYKCENTLNTLCDCEDSDDKGDDFDADQCAYNCYVKYGMEDICVADDDQGDGFAAADYVECQQAQFNGNNGGRRSLEEQVAYYIGPYCAEQGGSIFLGLFTDDTCTTFADNYGGANTYSSITGTSLPYSTDSLISMDCIDCKEPSEYNEDGNDAQDDDEVIEMCEQIYAGAGKCEQGLQATGYLSSANTNACNYIQGIRVVRKDGIITQVGSKANKTASVFIGIFVVAFVLLAAYVYYLKTKLDRASINLTD